MDEMEQVCIRLEVYFGFYRPKQPILGVCSTNTVISHCGRYNLAFEDSNTIINIFTDTFFRMFICCYKLLSIVLFIAHMMCTATIRSSTMDRARYSQPG